VPYRIDLRAETQTRVNTSFTRAIRRKDAAAAAIPITRKKSTPDVLGTMAIPHLPAELSPLLVAVAGTLVQVSKVRDDGWSYGNVVFTPDDASVDTRMPDTWSWDAGWFPDAIGRMPNQKDLEPLNERMGSGAADCLKPPESWSAVKDPLLAECLPASASETQEVTSAFMHTAPAGVSVKRVLRIQNLSMWQSYAVKRQTILSREQNVNTERLERRWLFHGTNVEVLDKIIQQGFNRSFCGKNATMYGKGVYFARDARYSCNKTYSVPDSSGVQHMFVCRVTVGEYCRGQKDALTPDVRMGNVLYDSTVDVIDNPSLFVCYHDAQAYPEYVVEFKS